MQMTPETLAGDHGGAAVNPAIQTDWTSNGVPPGQVLGWPWIF
jgi:hypothetical protein